MRRPGTTPQWHSTTPRWPKSTPPSKSTRFGDVPHPAVSSQAPGKSREWPVSRRRPAGLLLSTRRRPVAEALQVRVTALERRAAQHAKQIKAIRDMVHQGMRLVVATRKDLRELAAAQKRTEASLRAS